MGTVERRKMSERQAERMVKRIIIRKEEMERKETKVRRRVVRKRTGRIQRRRGKVRTRRRASMTGITRRIRRMVGRMGRRIRRVAVARATCCLTLFTTSSGASTWPWNRHLRNVLKTNSIIEKIELGSSTKMDTKEQIGCTV